jgi:hypothetical protein
VNDWYDKVPCHQQREFTDRTNGRIYKVTTDSVKPVSVDLSKASEAELVQYQLHANDWYVRHARRILQERGLTKDGTAALEKILFENPYDTRQLRALWALHCGGGLSEATALRALKAESEWVRGWAVTLLCEGMPPKPDITLRSASNAYPAYSSTPPSFLGEVARLAMEDKSPSVRLRIASAAQRIPVMWRWPILTALASHAEDANDQNLPLMLWYAAEPAVAADTAKAAELLASCQIPKVQEFITRRIASGK